MSHLCKLRQLEKVLKNFQKSFLKNDLLEFLIFSAHCLDFKFDIYVLQSIMMQHVAKSLETSQFLIIPSALGLNRHQLSRHVVFN